MKKLLNGCGNNRHLKSLTTNKIKKLTKMKLFISSTGWLEKIKEIKQNDVAVANSTKGYCHEIGDLQERHFPPSKK